MRFERGRDPKDSMVIGVEKIAAKVERISFSITGKKEQELQPHELQKLLRIWDTNDWKSMRHFFYSSPSQIAITIGDCEHNLCHSKVSLRFLEGSWLKCKDGTIIQVPKHLIG